MRNLVPGLQINSQFLKLEEARSPSPQLACVLSAAAMGLAVADCDTGK